MRHFISGSSHGFRLFLEYNLENINDVIRERCGPEIDCDLLKTGSCFVLSSEAVGGRGPGAGGHE